MTVQEIVSAFEAGIPRWQLADQHKISVRSVGRLLHTCSQWIAGYSHAQRVNSQLGIPSLLGRFPRLVAITHSAGRVFEIEEGSVRLGQLRLPALSFVLLLSPSYPLVAGQRPARCLE